MASTLFALYLDPISPHFHVHHGFFLPFVPIPLFIPLSGMAVTHLSFTKDIYLLKYSPYPLVFEIYFLI